MADSSDPRAIPPPAAARPGHVGATPAGAPLPDVPLYARQDRALGHITIQRPAPPASAANALTPAMQRQFAEAIVRWGRDPNIYAIVLDAGVGATFCPGADQTDRCHPALSIAARAALLAEETRLIWQVECCVKPMASLIDGTIAGLGAGLALMGTHRVAGAGYSLAMADPQTGLSPAAGSTAALARLPANIGLYLAVTGTGIGRADAYALGLVTHCIDRQHFEGIRQGLADADPIDPLLDDLHRHPGDGAMTGLRPAIERCFAHDTGLAILEALTLESGENRSWARQTAAVIAGAARDDLEITLQQVRMARGRDLKETLEREHHLAVLGLLRLAGKPIADAAVLASAHELVLPPRPQSLVALS